MSYRDFETKKSLHINLTKETHTEIKITAFRHGLSMQEIFEELARQIVEGDSHMQKTLEEMQLRKRTKAGRKFSQTDAESIFRVIEDSNPITGE
tara:strand:+ start:23344 stop:23625 length:282 start_codon:yes stop_codon:yes gene_type:complete